MLFGIKEFSKHFGEARVPSGFRGVLPEKTVRPYRYFQRLSFYLQPIVLVRTVTRNLMSIVPH
jgi:hypothetical protein